VQQTVSNAGWTVLHVAAFFGHEVCHAKCCGLLIAVGVRLDVTTLDGDTR